MPAVFLVSDTHFGHAGVCHFTNPDDANVKLRPWTDPDEMDEEMIRRWNDRVRPTDKVYHLGDVVINRKALVFRINHTVQQNKKLALIYTNLHASTGFVKIKTV